MAEVSISEALQLGVEAHKAGKAQEADRYYTAILQVQPDHPDANHNMGVLAAGLNKLELALPFFKKALESDSNVKQYWLSFIDALLKLERLDEAKNLINQAESAGFEGTELDQRKAKTIGEDLSHKNNLLEPSLSSEQFDFLLNLYRDG